MRRNGCSRRLAVAIGVVVLACNARKEAGGQAPEQVEPVRVKYCFANHQVHDVEQCVGEMSEAEQRRRRQTVRLTYQGTRLVRREFVSGSGALVNDDVEDYQYEGDRVAVVLHSNRNGVALGKETFSEDRSLSRYVDVLGRPKVYDGQPTGTVKRRFDAAGRLSGLLAVDQAMKPTDEPETRYAYAADGALVERSFFGKSGEPVVGRSGAHRSAYETDARGLVRTARCYGVNGGPGTCRGAHREETKRDDVGNLLELSYYDAQGRRVRSTGWNAAIVRFTNDERGNPIVTSFFDEHERPTPGPDGAVTVKMVYDARDNVVERSFLGPDGDLVQHPKTGASIERFTLDERGKVVSMRFLDRDGARMMSRGGYFRVGREFDARDRLVRETYFDLADQPVELRRGHAVHAWEYDDGDRVVRSTYLDVAGKPTSLNDGSVREEAIYDENGKFKEWRSLDSTGAEVIRCEGEATEALETEFAVRRAGLRSCNAALYAENPLISGNLKVDLRIDEKGRVAHSRVAEDELGVPALADCVMKQLRRPYRHGATKSCVWWRFSVPFGGDRDR